MLSKSKGNLTSYLGLKCEKGIWLVIIMKTPVIKVEFVLQMVVSERTKEINII